MYLVISSFPALWTSPSYYNFSVQIGGLHFIALAIGYGIGSQITARFNDWTYKRLKQRNSGKGTPEFRVPVMIPCAILLPVGFFWYGWSAEARVFWLMPDIGAAILAAAMICGYQASKLDHPSQNLTTQANKRISPNLCHRRLHDLRRQRRCERDLHEESGGLRLPALRSPVVQLARLRLGQQPVGLYRHRNWRAGALDFLAVWSGDQGEESVRGWLSRTSSFVFICPKGYHRM